jgi:hypothetical protein
MVPRCSAIALSHLRVFIEIGNSTELGARRTQESCDHRGPCRDTPEPTHEDVVGLNSAPISSGEMFAMRFACVARPLRLLVVPDVHCSIAG